MNLLVLTYHYFHRDEPSGIKKEDFPFSVRLDDFDNHCAELISSGYHLIDPGKLTDYGQYHGEPDRQILITIDDGHQSVEEVAEIIVGRNLKPILFIIPDQVGKANYLDWPALRDLATRGFSIQSHSMTHRNLARLSQSELIAELEQSKNIIEDNIGLPVTMLAVPMGRFNNRVKKCAPATGYDVVMTSYTGINRYMDDPMILKRFQVKGERRILQLDDYFRRFSKVRITGAVKNLAKRFRGSWI
jgi:peptidoglycan/xylan/chitin deacetylase (PgdA/CDA1 family)